MTFDSADVRLIFADDDTLLRYIPYKRTQFLFQKKCKFRINCTFLGLAFKFKAKKKFFLKALFILLIVRYSANFGCALFFSSFSLLYRVLCISLSLSPNVSLEIYLRMITNVILFF